MAIANTTYKLQAAFFQRAFEHSLQPSIVYSFTVGNIILANRAAASLTGYGLKQLSAMNLANIIIATEPSFKKMLRQLKKGKSGSTLVTVRKKNGIQVRCEASMALFVDGNGTSCSITTLSDTRKGIRRQKKIDIRNEKVVANNITEAKSKQRKIDIRKDKIVAENIIEAKSKQRQIDIRKDKIVAENIVIAKTKQKKIDSKNKKIVAGNIVMAKTRQDKLDLIISDYEANFLAAFNASSDVLFDVDLVTDEIKISDGYEKSFGYTIHDNKMPVKKWLSHIHPGDAAALLLNYNSMLNSKGIEWKYNYRFVKPDHAVANVVSNAIILRNSKGKAYRMIGSMHDISNQAVLEEKLGTQIKLKEKEIAEAAEQAKDTERSHLGKELHDNVNQLLGASRLYLNMVKLGGENIDLYLSRSSEYTLTAIEEIRKLSHGLTTDTIKTLGLCQAIEQIVHDTMETNQVKITCRLKSFKERSVKDKFKLNLFRIIQEQLNNIVKYARATKISIEIVQDKNSLTLAITDNGVGFDSTKKRTGIGLDNIKSRAAYYNGATDVNSRLGAGCTLSVVFPSKDILMTEHQYPFATS